jgi:membrane peptidoglycan carboxypeptidase
VASLPGRPVAGKTGTTQENVDAWFAGYTPQLVTVVWEGYPAERNGDLVPQMGYCSDTDLCRPVDGYEVTGGGTPVSPAVIWHNFMMEATADMPVVAFPVPIDMPDTVINSAPPPPPAPPKPRKSEEPKEEPSEEPRESPEPTQESTPTDAGSGLPTPSSQPDRRRREKDP